MYEYMLVEVVKNYTPRTVGKKRYYQSEEAMSKYLAAVDYPRSYYDYEIYRREVGDWESVKD